MSARIVKTSSDGKEEIEEEVKVQYLIGTDGGKSSVRKQAEFTFLGESRVQDRFLVADIHIKGLDPNVSHLLVSFYCMLTYLLDIDLAHVGRCSVAIVSECNCTVLIRLKPKSVDLLSVALLQTLMCSVSSAWGKT